MSEIPIQIVDEHDKPIGDSSIVEAQLKGLYHRIAPVMVEDGAGNILLQKRQAGKRTYPNCWDNSAAGHVDKGESYEVAAIRELEEEIGISNYPLEEIKYYPTNTRLGDKILNRFNKLFRVVVPHDVHVTIQPEEVSETMWVTRSQLAELVQKHPNNVSDGLLEAFKKMYQT